MFYIVNFWTFFAIDCNYKVYYDHEQQSIFKVFFNYSAWERDICHENSVWVNVGIIFMVVIGIFYSVVFQNNENLSAGIYSKNSIFS